MPPCRRQHRLLLYNHCNKPSSSAGESDWSATPRSQSDRGRVVAKQKPSRRRWPRRRPRRRETSFSSSSLIGVMKVKRTAAPSSRRLVRQTKDKQTKHCPLAILFALRPECRVWLVVVILLTFFLSLALTLGAALNNRKYKPKLIATCSRAPLSLACSLPLSV